MKFRIIAVIAVLALPSALAAKNWQAVDKLPGDIVVELDRDSVAKVMDGANEVLQASFRRQMPTGVMESDVAMDCKNAVTRLRALRLVTDKETYNEPISQTTDFHAVSFGSSDAIYYKALCGKEIPTPAAYNAQELPAAQ